MVIINEVKFRLIYNIKHFMKYVIPNSVDEKETQLKELVIKLLKEKNFSNYELLDSLFSEVKDEIKTR
ncbi:hypothetical protein [Candidatus Nitrosarchaeum limnium]|uniref:hypothetical protein n=1 Tax=Candidatus Nitrosarchaeum limnium TaxID=1007084 RepID=UPI0010628F77|nr:hypothetical protein [Candidatus Nitrosarchaeum limnium]